MADNPHTARPFLKSRAAIALAVFGAIALFLLLSEHRAHFLGVLPYLLLLSCPLMHLFMHHGHGHGHGDSDTGTRDNPSELGDSHERRR